MGGSCPCHTCHTKEFGIFSSLSNEELLKIKEVTHHHSYRKHQIIFHEDSPCQGFHILRSGRAKLIKSSGSGRQVILKIVNPAGFVGEHAVFENRPYAFTAQAMEDSEICFINKDDFFRVIKERSQVLLRVMSILSGELRAAREQIIDMALRNARERMACLIMGLAGEYGRAKDSGIVLELSLTRGELAEMIGVSQETAIRLVSEFKEIGLIDTNGRQMTILNEKGMMAAAAGEQLTLD